VLGKMTQSQFRAFAIVLFGMIAFEWFESVVIECSEQIIVVGRPLKDDYDLDANNRIVTIDELEDGKFKNSKQIVAQRNNNNNNNNNNKQHRRPSIGDRSLADLMAPQPDANINASQSQDIGAEPGVVPFAWRTKNDDGDAENDDESDPATLAEPKIEGK
jgi:hypothetical protein